MFIEFWQGLQQGPVLESFKQIVHEWNVQQPNYQVNLKNFTDYGAPVNEGLSAKPEEQPSLVLAPEFMTGKMIDSLAHKKVIPITQLLDKELLVKIADIVRLTFGDKDGNLVSLPFNPACGVLFTNKELLQAVDKDPNYIPRSIEELEEICKLLIDKNLVEAGYTCAWPAAYLVEVPAAQQDLPLVTPLNGKLGYGKYIFAQPWLKEHFLHLRKQQNEKIFLYAGKDNNSRHPFIQRKVAFYMQGSTHHSLLQKEANQTAHPFEVGCGPLPTLVKGQTDKYAFPLGGAAIWVLDNPNTQRMIGGVRAFLNYLASEDIQERWHKETAYVPVLNSLQKKLEEYHKSHPIHQAVMKQTIEATLGTYSFVIQAPNYAEARKELFDLIEKILDSKTSDDEINPLLEAFDAKYSL